VKGAQFSNDLFQQPDRRFVIRFRLFERFRLLRAPRVQVLNLLLRRRLGCRRLFEQGIVLLDCPLLLCHLVLAEQLEVLICGVLFVQPVLV